MTGCMRCCMVPNQEGTNSSTNYLSPSPCPGVHGWSIRVTAHETKERACFGESQVPQLGILWSVWTSLWGVNFLGANFFSLSLNSCYVHYSLRNRPFWLLLLFFLFLLSHHACFLAHIKINITVTGQRILTPLCSAVVWTISVEHCSVFFLRGHLFIISNCCKTRFQNDSKHKEIY